MNRTIPLLFYDVTTSLEFFELLLEGCLQPLHLVVPDEVVVSNRYLKWDFETPNAICAAIFSTKEEKVSSPTALVNVYRFLNSCNATLVYLGTERIRQVNTLTISMQELEKKDQSVDFWFSAVLFAKMNGFTFSMAV